MILISSIVDSFPVISRIDYIRHRDRVALFLADGSPRNNRNESRQFAADRYRLLGRGDAGPLMVTRGTSIEKEKRIVALNDGEKIAGIASPRADGAARAAHIRNVAIIAHVDHGKTTLVDALVRQCGMLRENEIMPERMMDTMDLERERGITISAKNCTIRWEDLTINIVDTPGHSDFGGEVERILSMVDGALLLVDAAEGPLPQTRFVLKKALEAGLAPVVVINKIDRPDQRTVEVENEIFSLFIDCGAEDWHIDSPVIYAIAREGLATESLAHKPEDMRPVFEAIRDHIPGPVIEENAPLSLLVANLDYSDYVGRLAIGRIRSGAVAMNDQVLVAADGREYRGKVTRIYGYDGLKRVEVERAEAGQVVAIAGFEDVTIGDTITAIESPRALPRIHVEEPTVAMIFSANTAPFAGREGRFVTARQIKDRLWREAQKNVSLKITDGETPEQFNVCARGELQLAILIEQMRREGFELEVGRPQVIEKTIDGVISEPFEEVVIDIPEAHIGVVTERLSARRGVMTNMTHVGSNRVKIEFRIPARGLIGIRSAFLTDTRGTGLMHAVFAGYAPTAGRIPARLVGAIINDRESTATGHAIANLESRGRLFVAPGEPVYQGMIVGEHAKAQDIDVWIGRPKKLTNMRASSSDETIVLAPPVRHTLETAMEWINENELIEVTPVAIRLRKRFLDPNLRKDERRINEE
jgi:GTP-binding protein